ncbi:importin-11-like [Orbicella faveolata]|uniref:importin-11-like n=1 Tax=Orbicella faveolata TaxID=48498 RepID=UPI0009E64F64|nr:importin-11-like [Orbicella faveolata]
MRLLTSLELSTLTLKVLRKLIIYGLQEFEETSQAMCLLQAVFEKIKILLQYRKAETGNHDLQEKLEKYVILLTKVVSGVFFFIFNIPFILRIEL